MSQYFQVLTGSPCIPVRFESVDTCRLLFQLLHLDYKPKKSATIVLEKTRVDLAIALEPTAFKSHDDFNVCIYLYYVVNS